MDKPILDLRQDNNTEFYAHWPRKFILVEHNVDAIPRRLFCGKLLKRAAILSMVQAIHIAKYVDVAA
jgi:hypothetical protein